MCIPVLLFSLDLNVVCTFFFSPSFHVCLPDQPPAADTADTADDVNSCNHYCSHRGRLMTTSEAVVRAHRHSRPWCNLSVCADSEQQERSAPRAQPGPAADQYDQPGSPADPHEAVPRWEKRRCDSSQSFHTPVFCAFLMRARGKKKKKKDSGMKMQKGKKNNSQLTEGNNWVLEGEKM